MVLNFNLISITYKKPNKKVYYVNSKSNHPPVILNQIAVMITVAERSGEAITIVKVPLELTKAEEINFEQLFNF